MAKIEGGPSDRPSDSARPGGGSANRSARLVKCPHCGRFVPRVADAGGRSAGRPASSGAGGAFRCSSCGLEIKERHLA